MIFMDKIIILAFFLAKLLSCQDVRYSHTYVLTTTVLNHRNTGGSLCHVVGSFLLACLVNYLSGRSPMRADRISLSETEAGLKR